MVLSPCGMKVRKSKGNGPVLGNGTILLKWTSKGSEVDYIANGGIWSICGGCHESWLSTGDGFSIRSVLELVGHDGKKKDDDDNKNNNILVK